MNISENLYQNLYINSTLNYNFSSIAFDSFDIHYTLSCLSFIEHHFLSFEYSSKFFLSLDSKFILLYFYVVEDSFKIFFMSKSFIIYILMNSFLHISLIGCINIGELYLFNLLIYISLKNFDTQGSLFNLEIRINILL